MIPVPFVVMPSIYIQSSCGKISVRIVRVAMYLYLMSYSHVVICEFENMVVCSLDFDCQMERWVKWST